MKVNIIARKEKQFGSMSRYYGALAGYIQNNKIIYVDYEAIRLPVFKGVISEFIYNPLYVKSKLNDGIVHFTEPYFGHYLYLINPELSVVTCHDIYNTIFKKFRGLDEFFYELSMKGMLRAKKIIADSECTKKDLMIHLKCPEDKIRTVPLGVDINKYKKNNNYLKNDARKIILHVGVEGYKGRKNVISLIYAFHKLKKKIPEVKFIQAGNPKFVYADLVKELGLQESIEFLGWVLEDEKINLYNTADIFVFPSLYEGFGLPPLEAMACGCPVITSNAASLPEIVGDAGIMVDPHDIDGLAEAMYNVLTNDGLRKDMIKKGLERAKMFTWERTARETYEVYEEVWNKTN